MTRPEHAPPLRPVAPGDRAASSFHRPLVRHAALAALLLTLLWAPLAQGSTFGWGQSGLIILGGLTGALALLAALLEPRPPRLQRWGVCALLFLAWVWLSLLWSPQLHEATRTAGSWSAVIIAAVTAGHHARTRHERQAVILTLILAVTGALTLALLQRQGFELPGFTRLDTLTLSGPYFNSSHFSGYLIGGAALIASLILLRPGLITAPLLALLALLEFANLHTDSSSIPAVLLATGLPLLIWIWTRSTVAGAILTALSVSAFGLGTALFFTPQGQALFAKEQRNIGISRDWHVFFPLRQAVWHYPLAMTRAHPLLGVGAGQFQTEAPKYRRAERQVGSGMDRAAVNYAHNDALQLTAELGLPGALLFFPLLFLPLLRRPGGFSWLVWWSALPPLLFSGLYDAHLTAIPGTAAGMLTLAALAASSRRTVPTTTGTVTA